MVWITGLSFDTLRYSVLTGVDVAAIRLLCQVRLEDRHHLNMFNNGNKAAFATWDVMVSVVGWDLFDATRDKTGYWGLSKSTTSSLVMRAIDAMFELASMRCG